MFPVYLQGNNQGFREQRRANADIVLLASAITLSSKGPVTRKAGVKNKIEDIFEFLFVIVESVIVQTVILITQKCHILTIPNLPVVPGTYHNPDQELCF